jgi:hypothetical protein
MFEDNICIYCGKERGMQGIVGCKKCEPFNPFLQDKLIYLTLTQKTIIRLVVKLIAICLLIYFAIIKHNQLIFIFGILFIIGVDFLLYVIEKSRRTECVKYYR